MKNNPKYSIILPIYNEESCLPEVLDRIEKVFVSQGSYEVICVDDASKDSSWAIIQQFHQRNPAIKGIQFQRNFGHQLALYAGIKVATGDFIALMDGDGQDPPEILPEIFGRCESGYDVVYAVRKKRKENILKRFCYALFYRFYSLIVPFKIPLDSGDFSVFTGKVGQFIRSRKERNPFIRGLRSWYGGKQTGFEYERQARFAGQTKYSYWKLFLLAVNASVAFSRVPLRLITSVGLFTSFLAFVGGITIIIMKLTGGLNLYGWPSLAVLIMFFGGINLFVLGIVGEYIGDIFDEVKDRPAFLIGKSVGDLIINFGCQEES